MPINPITKSLRTVWAREVGTLYTSQRVNPIYFIYFFYSEDKKKKPWTVEDVQTSKDLLDIKTS